MSLRQYRIWSAWIRSWETTWIVIGQHMLNFPNGKPAYGNALYVD